MKLTLIVALAGIVGMFAGAHFFSVPLRTFAVDAQGNQHCSGLRHGESFEVFCLSTERPMGESANRNLDRIVNGRRHTPAAEDYRAPFPAVPRPPPARTPTGSPYAP